MNVTFYKINKKINSTKIPVGTGTTLNVVLKSPSSIINPRFELNQYLDVNYCYVAEFNRYYFINEIKYENPLWTYSCNVDVLASFKNDIGNSTKYVLRSASQRNELLIDNSAPMIATNDTNSTAIINVNNMASGKFVVGVVGNNAGAQTMYQMNVDTFQSLLSSLLTTADGYEWGDLTRGLINSVMNPFQYITSCRWYPVSFPVGSPTELMCGLWGSDVQASPILASQFGTGAPVDSYTFMIPKHPQTNTRGKYMNLSPFTRMKLDLGVFGIVDLDTTLLMGMDEIFVAIYVDVFSGIGTCYGWARVSGTDSTNRQLFKRQVQYGVNIPLSSNDASAVPSIISIASSVAMGIATGGASIGATALAVGGATGGVLDLASSMNGSLNTMSSGGSVLDHLQTLYLIATFNNQGEIDIEDKGRPLCQNKLISSLSGFIQCDDGVIESTATEQEKESIANYLASGFFYE